jgi:hypothetical protein
MKNNYYYNFKIQARGYLSQMKQAREKLIDLNQESFVFLYSLIYTALEACNLHYFYKKFI